MEGVSWGDPGCLGVSFARILETASGRDPLDCWSLHRVMSRNSILQRCKGNQVFAVRQAVYNPTFGAFCVPTLLERRLRRLCPPVGLGDEIAQWLSESHRGVVPQVSAGQGLHGILHETPLAA